MSFDVPEVALFLYSPFLMKKILAPLAFATLLLSACQASVTAPATEETSTSSAAVMEASSSSEATVEVDATVETMEATSSEAAAQ